MATKLALIDSDLLMRLLDKQVDSASPPANPILREMSTIDRQMHGALNDPGLSDLAKSQKVNSLLSKHDNFSRQFENQPPPTVTVRPQEDPERQGQDYWYSKTVASVPQTLKQKAQDLLDHIKSSKNIQWDSHGRIVIDNVSIPSTNVLDLVHSVTRQRKSRTTPEGAYQFVEALEKINTPKELVPNADLVRKMTGPPRAKTSTPIKPARKRRRKSSQPTPSSIDYDLSRINYDLWEQT